LAALASAIGKARRPVFVAGRGARHARAELERLAERCGALLATSAVANGPLVGNPGRSGFPAGSPARPLLS
jgi:thiamine pyrophosphate-dependent acetolactate synthase large subunit-like protein